MVIILELIAHLLEPCYLIQNLITEEAFEQMVYQWLSDGVYTPDDIIENVITKNDVVMVPLYCYANTYYGSCSASLGYQRKEYYDEWDSVAKKNVRKSRIVIDWHPHTQPTQGTTVTVIYSGTPIQEQILKFVEKMQWSVDNLLKVSSEAFEKDVKKLFKSTKAELWNSRGLQMATNDAAMVTRSELPSPLVQGLLLNINFTETMFYSVVAPYWLFRYDYEGKGYFLIADGNDPSRVEGIRPEDKKRKREVNKIRLVGWAVWLPLTLLALYYFSDESFENIKSDGQTFGIIFLTTIFIGALIIIEVQRIKRRSLKLRKSKLKTKLKQLNGEENKSLA